jgi:hypothetical protein
MKCPHNRVAWLVLGLCVLCVVSLDPARARPTEKDCPTPADGPVRSRPELTQGVPLQDVTATHRDRVRLVLERPTLTAHGPMEAFACQPPLYYWLLDHPDQAVPLWRRLGAKCMEITDKGGGRFGWADTHGSEVHWETVYRGPTLRIWYAEGNVRPAPLLPLVPARAVVVLRFIEGHDRAGRTLLRHQADLFLQTDSKTAALATRLLGPSGPRLAEQCVSQMEMFFSALAWYFGRYPERADRLVSGTLPADSPKARELRRLIAPPATDEGG